MNKYISILFLAILTAISANAQLLWQISGNSTNQKSYLFATNKLADISFLDSVPNLFKVWGRCDKVITEMAIHDFEAQKALAQAALLPHDSTISMLYSADEYRLIEASFMQTVKLPFDKLGRMKPAYLTELYRNELLTKELHYDDNRSSENFFQTVAMQQAIPVYALDDTGEALYMMFDREPMHWQQKELLRIVQYPERELQTEKAVLRYYKNGLLTELVYEVSMPDNQSTLSFSDCQVFWRRNLNWCKRLRPYLEQGNAFICLNALYLGGEQGLINVLRQNGYKVKPVNKK